MHTLRVRDLAKQAAHSGPPSALAIPKGDHSGAANPNQERNHDHLQSVGTSSKPVHDRIAQLYPRSELGK
jgi:hypothetical protein